MATDTDPDEETTGMVPVTTMADLEAAGGRAVVSVDGQAVALFVHEGTVHAVDNRCPHMGFPLAEGTVEDGVLTCHWHHARFELGGGDTFDPWADDVRTFPTVVRDGEVHLDPDPPRERAPALRWRDRLADGLNEDLDLVMAKAAVGLDDAGEGFQTPLETAVNFGTRYRAAGWGSGLTTLGCTATLYGHLAPEDRPRAMFAGVRAVAADCAGEPPRFQQYAFENEGISKDRLLTWLRDSVEVRDADGAERCLLTAVELLDPRDVADLVFTAATDSLYLDSGHTLDFLNTALATLDHLGWEGTGDEGTLAARVLAATVERLTEATRAEELSAWREPVDVAALCLDAHDRLPDCVAAGADRQWTDDGTLLETLLGDDPEAIVEGLLAAVRAGATRAELADVVLRAATRRVAWFGTSNEFGDWNTVHHTFSYANAVHQATRRTTTDALYRGCLDAAVSVYLDRFLNSPRAPTPTVADVEDPAAPETVREELLGCFDTQGQVDRAASLVVEHVAGGGDPATLKRTLGRALLREDAGFHTVQNLTWALERFDDLAAREAPIEERVLPLVATTRYMAAHFPTRRESEQTYSIAARLHRGERLHGSSATEPEAETETETEAETES